jgi:hypothetical protein
MSIFLAVAHILPIMSQSEYCRHYQSQRGGEITLIRGGSQSGAGIGDILRGLGRRLIPVVLRGISSFASHTLSGTEAGLSIKNAAIAAILLSLSAAVGFGSTGSSGQTGSGVLFDGENAIPTTEKAIGRHKRAVDIISGSPTPKRSRKSRKVYKSGTHYNF